MIENYKVIFQLSATRLLTALQHNLTTNYGYAAATIQTGQDYVYAQGILPVLLVAHVDTVHFGTPEKVLYDPKEAIMWSPDGLGADDRAGVLGILKILSLGLKPHVLFLDGEEKGGIGAKEAVKMKVPPLVKYIVELDRRGSEDAVFYDNENQEFISYITAQGFKTAHGSFSDISVLCPKWKISGVNLSIGYHSAHTKYEYLNLNEWNETVTKVIKMLKDIPDRVFPYQEKKKEPLVIWRGTADDYTYSERSNSSWCNNRSRGRTLERYFLTHTVSANELCKEYQGTAKEWRLWLGKNEKVLEQRAQDAMMEVIDTLLFEQLDNPKEHGLDKILQEGK